MNFNDTIVTRSKSKRKALYRLNDNGDPIENDGSSNISLNIKKKQKKTIIKDDNDSEYFPSDDDSSSSEDDDIIPMEEAWTDSCDIDTDWNSLDNDTTYNFVKDSLKDMIMDRVMKRLKNADANSEAEEDSEEEDEDEMSLWNNALNEKPVEQNHVGKEPYEYYKKFPYYKTLDKKEKEKIKNEEQKIKDFYKEIKPVEFDVLNMDTTVSNKSYMMGQLKEFRKMSPSDNEYEKLQKWVRGMSLIPFGKKIELPVNRKDSRRKINKFMMECYDVLDKTIYGQKNAKNKMIQIIAQWISNPNGKTNVIALEGPPGVGKTSLIKEGVSKALHRPFVFMPVGGSTDVSTFEGHGYTYTGATWGKIVQGLMNSQCMNPIFFFDELDKIGKTDKGDEVSGLLTHLTDPVQNDKFNDQFFGEIELNLNSAFFIFSYNDPKLINPILKDRLTIIKFENYKSEEKVVIGQKYMLPRILENVGLEDGDIIIPDQVIRYMITNFASMEKGVRELKRCLTEIVMKLNMMRFMQDADIKVRLPFTVSVEIAGKLLKTGSSDKLPDHVRNLYV